jgi:hypothetical protein
MPPKPNWPSWPPSHGSSYLNDEAWLRLGPGLKARFENRVHILGAAAEATRRILIDRARSKQARRHGGGPQRIDVDEVEIAAPCWDDELLAVNDGYPALSLSVSPKNYILKLYTSVGFRRVRESGSSWTLMLSLGKNGRDA